MRQNIKYGFVDYDNVIYTLDNENFGPLADEKWHLSSPERLLKDKYGMCWDQVELERDWFSKHNYNFKTYFIHFEYPCHFYSTHTFLIYEDNNKWYCFENANEKYNGIYEFTNLEDALKYQKNINITENKKNYPVTEKELKLMHIYEYDKPTLEISEQDYIEYILNTGKEIKL